MIYEQEKFNTTVGKLMEMWQNGDVAGKMTTSIITRKKNDRPSSTWSIGNRMIMSVVGNTDDARGIYQWGSVKRNVIKDEKAFHIWCPLFKKYTDSEGKEKSYCYGFKPIPVFSKESTNGAEIVYPDHTPATLPPLYDVAARYGIKVEYVPHRGFDSAYVMGSEEKIVLGTQDAPAFVHELVNAMYIKRNSIKEKQPVKSSDGVMEEKAIKDLTTAVICEMYSLEGYSMMEWSEMQDYFSRKPEEILRVMTRLMAETEELVSELLK